MAVTGTAQPTATGTSTSAYSSNQLGYLEDRIRRIVGDSDEDKWSHDDIMETMAEAVDMFSDDSRIDQEYEVLGADNSRYFNPTMTRIHKSMLCYYTALLLMLGDKAKASRVAINFSNPAGGTNLTNVPREIQASIDTITSKLNSLINTEWRENVDDAMGMAELTTQE